MSILLNTDDHAAQPSGLEQNFPKACGQSPAYRPDYVGACYSIVLAPMQGAEICPEIATKLNCIIYLIIYLLSCCEKILQVIYSRTLSPANAIVIAI